MSMELYEDIDDFIIFSELDTPIEKYGNNIDNAIPSDIVKYNINVTYGSNVCFINVTDTALFCFKNNNKLIILKDYFFNEYFGDPHEGIVKDLIVRINGLEYIIGENRNNDFLIDLDTGDIIQGIFADILPDLLQQELFIHDTSNNLNQFNTRHQEDTVIEI